MNLFATPAELGNTSYLFRILDNGGATADRYTVAFCDGDFLTLSAHPSSPVGVSMWGEDFDPENLAEEVENGRAVDLALGDLPDHLQAHIIARVNEAFRDFMDQAAKDDPEACAPNRKAADENDGARTCAGVGLYRDEDGYMIRVEGADCEDYGPFETIPEAVRWSLPDPYSVAGSEYHPDGDPGRLEPSAEVAAALAELVARVEAGEAE